MFFGHNIISNGPFLKFNGLYQEITNNINSRIRKNLSRAIRCSLRKTIISNSHEHQENIHKAVNKKLHEQWKQNIRAGPIRKMPNSEYVDKEGSVK